MTSKIDWTDETWPVLAGCSPASEGCAHCYACRLVATRLKHLPDFKGLADWVVPGTYQWLGVRLLPHRLEKPLRWRKPRRVFVVDKGDLFHPDVPFEYIAAVYGIMAACPRHTFQVLTKRPERMLEWYRWLDSERLDSNGYPVSWYPFAIEARKYGIGCNEEMRQAVASHPSCSCAGHAGQRWPLPNVWVGTSVETQPRADERIPLLLQVPAAVHFASVEPQLGKIAWRERWMSQLHRNAVKLIICGCESGPRARPFNEEWARIHRDVCAATGAAFFYKQAWRNVWTCATCKVQTEANEPPDTYQPGDSEPCVFCEGTAKVKRKLVKMPMLDGQVWDQMPEAAP